MWPFSNKTNYSQEMRNILKDYMLQYIKENPLAADDVVPIFSDAEVMIRNFSEKEISKMMKENNVNAECGALNILQNFAMTKIQSKSAKDFLFASDYAYILYNDVNDLKLKKGYISQEQYDENELLATKLSIQSPFGWI